jgi:uncharacterized membrane protein HdeD (DUF308 family)
MSTVAENWFQSHVRKESGRFMWVGVALIVLGVAALVFPMVSTLVATVFVGWMLIFGGVVTLFGAFAMRGAGPFFAALLYGLLSLGAGAYILARPVGGEVAITLGLGAIFMVQGAYEALLAFELRPASSWGWVLMSAVASIVLSLAILVGWPGTSLFAVGVIIGVNFISSGLALLGVGIAGRRAVS